MTVTLSKVSPDIAFRYEVEAALNAGGSGGAVDSVNGQTGAVVLDKSDIGLGAVNNTSDMDKPVSTATATALSGKQDAGTLTIKSATITVPSTQGGTLQHTQAISDAAVTNSSKIMVMLGAAGDADENEAEKLDVMALSAVPGSGTFTVTANFATRTAGAIKLNYILGA